MQTFYFTGFISDALTASSSVRAGHQSKQWVDGSNGQCFGWVIWVDALSPMTHLHIYRKHVVKATFAVGDNNADRQLC